MDAAPRKRFRFQFRVATLFWITLSIAMFFAGRHWDEIIESIPSGTGNGTRITLTTGTSTVITTAARIPQILWDNETVAQVKPLGPNQIQVSGLSVGVASVNLWDENGKQMTYTVRVRR